MAPNDKWSLPAHASYWMRAANVPPHLPLPPSRRILIVTAYRGQFTLDLSLAALLAWRGHQVTLGYLPRLGSPIKPPLKDHGSARPYLAAALRGVESASSDRVRVIDLSEAGEQDAPLDQAMVESQARADAVMHLRAETIDENLPHHAEALAFYREESRNAHRTARNFLSRNAKDFDLLIPGNGMSFVLAHFAHVAKQVGLDFVTLDKFAFRHVRLMNHGDGLFSFDDLGRLWRERYALGFETEPFRSEACARAMEILNERRMASQRNWTWSYQSVPGQEAEDAFRAAGVDPSKPYVLICTNVAFDAGFYNFTTLFSTMREWLVETVSFLLRETDVNVVVRVHPGEKLHFGNAESSVQSLVDAGFGQNSRLTIIDAGAPVNSYPLMERCRAGVVFSSTTGIEMAMLGRRVVVGADVYFAKRGFTRDGVNRQDYFEALRESAQVDPPAHLSRKWAQAAQLFHYCVHYAMQYPYCYDKGADLVERPPHRLAASDDIRPSLKFLDALATPTAAFEAALATFHGVAGEEASPVDEIRAVTT
ncbi:MAG: hypothetical protein AB7K04_11885 [Pseudorhodoplanes sp.]